MDKIINWINEEMPVNEWLNISKEKVETYKKLFPIMMEKHDIELTFNNTYTKIKKTVWKNGKPI